MLLPSPAVLQVVWEQKLRVHESDLVQVPDAQPQCRRSPGSTSGWRRAGNDHLTLKLRAVKVPVELAAIYVRVCVCLYRARQLCFKVDFDTALASQRAQRGHFTGRKHSAARLLYSRIQTRGIGWKSGSDRELCQ